MILPKTLKLFGEFRLLDETEHVFFVAFLETGLSECDVLRTAQTIEDLIDPLGVVVVDRGLVPPVEGLPDDEGHHIMGNLFLAEDTAVGVHESVDGRYSLLPPPVASLLRGLRPRN